MSIHARRTKGGTRYDVRLRDPAGQPYKRTFRTKREAETFQAQQRADRSRGLWLDPRQGEMNFGRWADEWLAGDARKRPRTRARDAEVIRVHLAPTLGTRPLASITPLDVRRLVASWAERYQPTTTRRHYAVLRAILAAAVEADLLGRSPCRKVKLPAVEPHEPRLVTPEELAHLAEVLGADYGPMAYVGAVLGLRWGECAGLRVGRLDLLRSKLTVAETLGEVNGAVVVSEPKSRAGLRTLAVPERLVSMLSEHLARRGLSAADADAFVFVSPDGGPLRYANWRSRVWRPAVVAAGLESLTFHALRHAATTAMLTSGVDLRTAQVRLGHSDPRLTLGTYAHATPDSDQDAAERVGAHFMASPAEHGENQDSRDSTSG